MSVARQSTSPPGVFKDCEVRDTRHALHTRGSRDRTARIVGCYHDVSRSSKRRNFFQTRDPTNMFDIR